MNRCARALVAVGALAVLASCGSDEDATSASTEATTSVDEDRAAYCTDVLTLDQMFQHLDAEDPAAFEAALAEAVPVMDRVVATAPSDLQDEHSVVASAFTDVVESGDPTPFFAPDVEAAGDTLHAANLADCGWTSIEISAEDFRFAGRFPSEAGETSFDLVNTGAEAHALIVARKLDDVEGSAMDAFEALASEEAFPTVFEQAVSVFAEPGDAAYGLADLTPGEYIAFCPIPSGTTGEESIGDGPPHFVNGMVTSFEVVER